MPSVNSTLSPSSIPPRRMLPYPDDALRRGGMEEGDSVELTDGILHKV